MVSRTVILHVLFGLIIVMFADEYPTQHISTQLLLNSTDFTYETDCDRSLNYNCIHEKVFNFFKKLPHVLRSGSFQLGPVEFVKLPSYAADSAKFSGGYDESEPRGQSFSSTVVTLAIKGIENFLQTYGIRIPLPEFTKDFPGIIVEDSGNSLQVYSEGRGPKRDQKKLALIFPLIAMFKFIIIKALLIPILVSVLIIKKLLIVGAMAIPILLAMLRVCRFGGGGGFFPGPGFLTAAAPMSPYMSGATDAIVGDFSSYSHMTQTPYNNRHDYGGRSYSAI